MRIKHNKQIRGVVLSVCLATGAGAARAAEFGAPEASGFYGRAGAAARFNVGTTLTARNPVRPPGEYDDGYVLPDRGGSDTLTWNWGYQNADQYDGANIRFERYDDVPDLGTRQLESNETAPGAEVILGYAFQIFEVRNRPVRMGFELGYSYAQFSQKMNYRASGTATYTVATHSLNGVIPPEAPYEGTPRDPGPLLNLDGDVVPTTSEATTTFQAGLEGDLHNLRFGPMFEIDVTEKWTLGFGFGYASMYIDASMDYREATAFVDPTVPDLRSSAELTEDEWKPGVYVEARVNYQFTERIGAYLSADFQHNDTLDLSDRGHRARIDLGSTFAAKAGIVIQF